MFTGQIYFTEDVEVDAICDVLPNNKMIQYFDLSIGAGIAIDVKPFVWNTNFDDVFSMMDTISGLGIMKYGEAKSWLQKKMDTEGFYELDFTSVDGTPNKQWVSRTTLRNYFDDKLIKIVK
jgi:hypothetical protein